MPVRLDRPGSGEARDTIAQGRIEGLPATPNRIRLHRGERLNLMRSCVLGRPALRDEAGRVLEPARISCSTPSALDRVEIGHRVLFDDGRIADVVGERDAARVVIEITHTREGGGRLGEDKGINLPDSAVELVGLSLQDRVHFPFAARHADVIGLSFVDEPEDVRAVHAELDRQGAAEVGLLLKIETRLGFERLPWLLLEAMRRPKAGVMIARGDLAVECGWERMAEIQEEILWLCEAAHVPVVWATQVLESLAKEGMPSRAEITDAAMAQRAECVMLNKGPHIVEAIRTLDDILRRMEGHQQKKTSRLRRLKVSDLSQIWVVDELASD